MALTPDDVVTKQFQHVRFKDGFDPDEVDDFLDEIVVEWRKALEENAELKTKLAAYESGEAQPAAAAPSVDEAPAVEAPAPAATPAPAPAPVDATGPTTATAGIIELAQRLHDQHVAEGEAKKNQLISEAQAEVDRINNEAQAKHREEAARLERERNTLEARITELRNFERDYRTQLRGYIEGQLRDLDEKSASTDSTPVSAIGL